MDARTYFELTDAIAAAATPQRLRRLEAQIRDTEMHPIERVALERVTRVRADLLERRPALPGVNPIFLGRHQPREP